MSSLTNINSNSSVINVGRTTPVNPGAAPANESIPVVLATDQQPIPVIEQQKIQSEVALSMLGIPRGEVALGIFSDVNTYDVNPSEWASFPEEYVDGHGIKHLPQEAGAIVQAPKDKIAILSSKRFFRYQPGRVSAATFGVKASISPSPTADDALEVYSLDLNPSIKKYGIFDKFDGYYWETRGDATGDNFAVVRRTQSLINLNSLDFSNAIGKQNEDYRMSGKAAADSTPEPNAEIRATEIIVDNLFTIIDTAYIAARDSFVSTTDSYIHLATNSDKCKRDAEFAIHAYLLDLQYGRTGHTIVNATTYRSAKGPTAPVGLSSAIVVGGNILSNDAKRTAENELHERIGLALIDVLGNEGITSLNGSLNVATRINELVTITRTAVGDGSTLGVQPSSAILESTSTSIWGRNKIKTISEIYKKYLGYLVSTAFVPGAGSVTIDGVTTTYLDLYNNTNLKYKCLRDVKYITDGYMRDLVGGGNSATVYNMKNYYFNNVLQVVSTFADNYTAVQFHEDAHQLLRTLIAKNGTIASTDNPAFGTANAANWDLTTLTSVIGGWTSVLNLFGLQSYRTRITTAAAGGTGLADEVIKNFAIPYDGRLDLGLESQFGDLVVLRDGLIHIHAGVYDPSLLKETKRVRVKVDAATDTLHVAEGAFVAGQNINFIGNVVGLTSNKFYAVKTVDGPLSNIITLYDITDETKATINITSVVGTDHFIEPNVPFIFPDVYQKGNVLGSSIFRRMDGMFPYMYTEDTNLPNESPASNNSVGYIDTAIDTTTLAYETLRSQIDFVNLKYNNWVKQNIDPRYYAVYEYRVPRSRFSTDKLDGPGATNKKVVYSDVASGEVISGDQSGVSKVRPGQNVVVEGVTLEKTSVWDIDLTKVTMLKVEFSWYGAVGALFLAYVPVGNGDARWVRVHHLRASNQLKISSLGNATLPITYLTYGGGTPGTKLGIPDGVNKSYGSFSDHIVKYGASYYIDGGDRGTVRLYSHTNIVPTKTYGRTYNLTQAVTVTPVPDNTPSAIQYPYITLTDFPTIERSFFMKAQVITNSVQDQNVQVIWVDGDKLYLNKSLSSIIPTNVRLIAKRPSISFGLKAKQNIFNSKGTGVRNRVQVYPTKLSTANFETVPVTLDIIKSPVFQTITPTTGDFILSQPYTVSTANPALVPVPPGLNIPPYLANDGDETYGWFLSNVGSVFGKLYKKSGFYYFELRDVFPQEVVLFATFKFLKDGRFEFDGKTITSTLGYESTSQKERLSSVFISNVVQAPIPDTGSVLTSFFLSPGANQFDLLSYFDYNKDYLSFPLTDKVESIYLSASLSGASTNIGEINTSITWEEQ